MDSYYLIYYNKAVYTKNDSEYVLSLDEANSVIKNNGWNNAKIINICSDTKLHNVEENYCLKKLMTEKQYCFDRWNSQFLNDNINGFSLPIKVKEDGDYILKLKEVFDCYLQELNCISFKYRENLLKEVEQICGTILESFNKCISGKETEGIKLIKELIQRYNMDTFFVSELTSSYAFRGIAPFAGLHSHSNKVVYNKMMSEQLTFFRGRTKQICNHGTKISTLKDMMHLPFDCRHKASQTRFAKKDVPCLYLGVSSHVCANECNYNKKEEELFVSSFITQKESEAVKILNLVVSQVLINGIFNRIRDKENSIREDLQNSMLKFLPLVIATSFTVENKDKNKRSEYVIAQLLMEAVSELGIDGIAYLSRQGDTDFQYPQGVNLVLPCTDISKEKQYSKYCKMFMISAPVKFDDYSSKEITKKSYINCIYLEKDKNGFEKFISKATINGTNQYYGNSVYGVFDDYLVSQEHQLFNN